MVFSLTPMKKEEQKYSFSQSSQISGQTGLIGYLRADLDTDGNGFFSTWTDYRNDLKTPAFKEEFDQIIASLRFDNKYMGLLKNRTSLMANCYSVPNSSFSPGSNYYGFRVNSDNYAYLLRLNPNKGEYNLYCYCYKKDWLDNHIQKAEKGIRFINSHYKELFRIADGDMIRIQSSDMTGYDEECRYIDDYHLEVDNNLFHICEFAEKMERNGKTVIPLRSSLPDISYVYDEGNNTIGIVEKGIHGCYIIQSENSEEPVETIKQRITNLNRELGVTPAQEKAMQAGSIYGWDKPVADPKNYTEDGKFIKNHKERGDAR